MLMNMKSNSKVGKAITETASIAYTGELLPAGTASYSGITIDATKRYLKNSGKDKTPALVESGQGKFFNGTNQYIDTGATPNDSEGTFISRFTYASGAIQKIMAGMNYSNNRCYMGINASGKIGVGFGANTYDTLFSPDTLVAGRSYHVVFRYNGSTYWLFVDSVLKATGTITGLTTFAGTSFFIGALNNGGTASNHFNNVIDETYYYDVALTDAQIESLYKYPEKVKSYNGAIVPDIGSEANCKLFLPMCENSGSNVYNVAVTPATVLALTNYTTAMHTSASKLSYGAQCTAWKRDSLGVLLGMSNGLSFDGGVSVKGISTGWYPNPTEAFYLEGVYKITDVPSTQYDGVNYPLSTSRVRMGISSDNRLGGFIGGALGAGSAVLTTGYYHLVVKYDKSGLGYVYVNGVLVSQGAATAFTVQPTLPFMIGAENNTTPAYNHITPIFTPKIYKGAEYAKFNIAKAWAKAQKTIAKLGA